MRAHLESATVFCLPCVVDPDGNRDALPTVLLEALATGLPCISTPVTGVPEILGDGEAGRIVPTWHPPATARALRELLESPEERTRLARAGRERVEALFDARKVALELHSWFESPALTRT